MSQALDALRSTWAAVRQTHYFALLVSACQKTGFVEEGLTLVAEALNVIEATGERFCESELYRLKGELLLDQGNAEEQAESCLCQAVEVAHQQHAKSAELQAAMSLSRLWLKQGKRTAARNLLGEIYSSFSEGFETQELLDAKARLDKLG
jgi:predicted ATPase